MKIEHYDLQIENIREKMERTSEMVESDNSRLQNELENGEKKVANHDMYTNGTYDPYNPTEKDIENGAVPPDKNKKLPKPF
ncbi:MAG: hypothetical protein IJ709_05725 [Selenomonas sp.]|nr:hypothetical protein [Selenomonas sp.]